MVQTELAPLIRTLRRVQHQLTADGGTLGVKQVENAELIEMLQNLATKQLVIFQHGRFTLRHESVRQAVEARYMGAAGAARVVHAQLARFFEVVCNKATGTGLASADSTLHRPTRELAFHQAAAGIIPAVQVIVRVRPVAREESSEDPLTGRSALQTKGKQVMMLGVKGAGTITHTFDR